jgi:hypothetical protein
MQGRCFVVGLALAAAGCATTARPVVTDEQLARVPAAERRALIEQETATRVAETNAAAAKAARRDAERFRGIVDRQVAAAMNRVRAAESAVSLARTAKDADLRDEGGRELLLGRAELGAARAKRSYADELVALRDAELERRQAEVDVARARHELRKLDTLRRHGEGASADRDRFVGADARARARLAHAGDGLRDRRARFDRAKDRWLAARRDLARVRADVTAGTLVPPRAPSPVSPP